jgi:N-acetylneuraminate synthase/N,N'-diacetyllegionaminate synthase
MEWGTVGLEPVEIAGRLVGEGKPCFIIAEAGVNHNGDVELGKKLIDAAKSSGADAVKFQAFRAERLATRSARKANYQRTAQDDDSQFEMLRRLELSGGDFKELADHSRRRGIIFLSSCFDPESADLLEKLDIAAYKMGSGELTNLPLLRYVASKGRPMILSSGMSTMEEVAEALEAVREGGCDHIVLLHCISSYPAKAEDVNLRVIRALSEHFKVHVGFSDHTLSLVIPAAAVTLGAVMVEKHFTLDHSLSGPDHGMSLEPKEFRGMVANIREVEEALGDGVKRVREAERQVRAVSRRSVVAAVDIPAGTRITSEMLDIKRPGIGIEPKRIGEVVGKKAKRLIGRDELISWEALTE